MSFEFNQSIVYVCVGVMGAVEDLKLQKGLK